MMKKE